MPWRNHYSTGNSRRNRELEAYRLTVMEEGLFHFYFYSWEINSNTRHETTSVMAVRIEDPAVPLLKLSGVPADFFYYQIRLNTLLFQLFVAVGMNRLI